MLTVASVVVEIIKRTSPPLHAKRNARRRKTPLRARKPVKRQRRNKHSAYHPPKRLRPPRSTETAVEEKPKPQGPRPSDQTSQHIQVLFGPSFNHRRSNFTAPKYSCNSRKTGAWSKPYKNSNRLRTETLRDTCELKCGTRRAEQMQSNHRHFRL